MGKFFSSIKTHISSLITLFVLCIIGAYYFFIYVPGNERTVQERHFRCLQNIDQNIREKIKESVKLLGNILIITIQHKNEKKPDSTIDQYKKKYNKLHFVILDNTLAKRDSVGSRPLGLDTIDYKTWIKIDAASQQLLLFAADTAKNGPVIEMRFQFRSFIKPLLPGEIFTGYLIFVKDTKIYESFPTGLNYEPYARDSLLDDRNGITTSGIHDFRIGGNDYKVFSQPAYTYTGDQWIVSGLVRDEDYKKEKDQLPVGVVEFLITSVIILLVSLPWIKLYHMGNKDKLAVMDGIASLLVSMIMMSLLFFVFFKYNPAVRHKTLVQPGIASFFPQNHSKTDEHRNVASCSQDEYSRNVLASKIIAGFENEIDNAYLLLDSFDQVKSKLGLVTRIKDTEYDSIKNSHHINASQIGWLGPTGKVTKYMTNENPDDVDIPMNSDLSDRTYFKKARDGNFNKTTPYPYYVDQIISRSSNLFESIIAMRSHTGNEIAIMNFRTHSLENVVMPDGFSFAIIDGTGKVLYHSIPERNLNENLEEEFADSSNLVSCLEAKSDTSFTEKYYGRLYNIKIKPFPDMPYFAVILEDKEYLDSRDTEPYAFTLGMLVCLLSFLVLEFAVIFFASAKRSFFKKQGYDISWIGPKISSRKQYNLAILFNLIITLLLIVFFSPDHFPRYIYIILISITSVSLFLNAIFAKSYYVSNPHFFRFKFNAIICLAIFISLINIAMLVTLRIGESFIVIIYELILAGIGIFLFRRGHDILAKIRERSKRWHHLNYTHSFALMTLTRLIITSGIPVAFFFICSYNYEVRLDTRYRQLKFGRALTQRPDFIQKRQTAEIDRLTHQWGIYSDQLYIDSIKAAGLQKLVPPDTLEDLVTRTILGAFRFQVNDIEIKNNNMNLADGGDSVSFSPLQSTRLFVKNRYNRRLTRTYVKIDSNAYLKISSGAITYRYPGFRNWLWWPLFFVAIAIFYLLIHRIIRKLFALDLPSAEKWNEVDRDLITNNKLNNLLFIVGSPGSQKLLELKKKIVNGSIRGHSGKPLKLSENKENGNVHIADMILIPTDDAADNYDWGQCKLKALDDDCELVIINHFEYNIKDPATNRAKLNFLEALMHKDSSKIAIVSTVHPVSFLDSFNNWDNTDEKPAIPQNELERWHVLLGHFRVVITPLTCQGIAAETKMPDEPPKFKCIPRRKRSLQYLMMDEIRYGHFMNKLRAVKLVDNPPDYEESDAESLSDSLIFKLQLTSEYFYTYIWQSLTREEKLLLYDLAEDGLVNSYDDRNLCMLIAKGLVVRYDGTLKLFNQSFRNFILTAIGITEAKRIKEQVKDTGNWGSLKTPLNLVILAILFFLILSQQESYSRIITYITTVGAGFSAIIRIFPALGSKDTQKTP